MKWLRQFEAKEVVAAAIAIGIGGFTVWYGLRYPVGQLHQIGPGFFPLFLGVIMAGLGIAVLIGAAWAPAHNAREPATRSFFAVLGGVLAFALLLGQFGLVAAVSGLVLISSLAEPRLRIWHTLVLAAGLSTLAVLVFVKGLGMAVTVLPKGWAG